MACRKCIKKRNKILKLINLICCFKCKKIQSLDNDFCVKCNTVLEKDEEEEVGDTE